jgi:hypothetical protein
MVECESLKKLAGLNWKKNVKPRRLYTWEQAKQLNLSARPMPNQMLDRFGETYGEDDQ